MPDIGVAAVHHDLHAIAAAGLIAVADKAHVAGGVIGLWKGGAGHRIVSAFDFCAARQKLARLLTDRGLIGIVGAPDIRSPRPPGEKAARLSRVAPRLHDT